jgi:hypothetical protein
LPLIAKSLLFPEKSFDCFTCVVHSPGPVAHGTVAVILTTTASPGAIALADVDPAPDCSSILPVVRFTMGVCQTLVPGNVSVGVPTIVKPDGIFTCADAKDWLLDLAFASVRFRVTCVPAVALVESKLAVKFFLLAAAIAGMATSVLSTRRARSGTNRARFRSVGGVITISFSIERVPARQLATWVPAYGFLG